MALWEATGRFGGRPIAVVAEPISMGLLAPFDLCAEFVFAHLVEVSRVAH